MSKKGPKHITKPGILGNSVDEPITIQTDIGGQSAKFRRSQTSKNYTGNHIWIHKIGKKHLKEFDDSIIFSDIPHITQGMYTCSSLNHMNHHLLRSSFATQETTKEKNRPCPVQVMLIPRPPKMAPTSIH